MVKNQAKTAVSSLAEAAGSFLLALNNISSLENELGCVDGKIIGTGRPDYTQDSTEYRLIVDDNEFLLIDIPGIEGDEKKFKEIIQNSLMKAHVIFYVNGSGKKAEKDTLEKIKNYMHDGTSVYAIFNVHCVVQNIHCRPKEERIEGIDKSYQEELSEAYKKQRGEIVPQTEEHLRSFLGENFKGSICVNGLLSFCTAAMDSAGNTTIVKDDGKNLRASQTKLLKAYANDVEAMRSDSFLSDVQNIIEDKIACFDEYILEENLKKLRTRLSDILSSIIGLRDIEKNKIKEFLRDYDTFEKNCEMAKDDFIHAIGRIGRMEVAEAFTTVQDALFAEIEYRKGKLESAVIERILDQHKDQISEDIQNAINNKLGAAIREYQESVQDAEKRLYKDLQRDRTKFEIEMNTNRSYYSFSFQDGSGLSIKGLTKGAFTIAGYTFSGFTVGSLFPGIGNIIGAVVGFIAGVFFTVWEFFASEAKRINRAKEKLKQAIDDQIDAIAADIRKKVKELGLEKEIESKHLEMKKDIAAQQRSLRDVERMFEVVVKELNDRYKKI